MLYIPKKIKYKKKLRRKYKKIILRSIDLNLKNTLLYNDLISIGAFNGDHSRWTHFSQINFLYGYRNNSYFYDINLCMKLLTKATIFLKKAIKKRKIKFIFVGNPDGCEAQSSIIFGIIAQKFFSNDTWEPGFFSRKSGSINYVLIIYNIKQNYIPYEEAKNRKIPIVGFVTPQCDIRGVDYPIVLNLKNNKLWYANFCKALFIKYILK